MLTTEAGKASEFRVTTRGDMLRIDMPMPSTTPAVPEVTLGHAVYDHDTNKVLLFFDTTREYREMDLSRRIAPGDADARAVPVLEQTGIRKVVAGVPCEEWSVVGVDGARTEACLAAGVAYLEMFHVELGPHGTESPLAREYREHKKFPLELVGRDAQGHERWRTEVTKVTPGSVDDAVFALPDAYRKVELHLGGAPSHS